jgi:steroid delta-isomerase-like uncharacterized protein
MSESSNIALIRRWMEEVWNQRRDATVRELLDPNAVGHLEGVTTIGIGEFLAARAFLLDAFPDFHLTIDEGMAQGSNVAVRWSAKGTHLAALMSIPATGTAVAFRGLTWFVINGGRIVEGWDSWNQGRLFADLRLAADTHVQGAP